MGAACKLVGSEEGARHHYHCASKLTARGCSRFSGRRRLTGAQLMDTFSVKKRMQIESGILTRSLEGAHKKAENSYYNDRKRVYQYEEVMNNLHKGVNTERQQVLEGRELKALLVGYRDRTTEVIVEAYVDVYLPPEERHLTQLVVKTKEFIYMVEEITPKHLQVLYAEGQKVFLQEQLGNAHGGRRPSSISRRRAKCGKPEATSSASGSRTSGLSAYGNL